MPESLYRYIWSISANRQMLLILLTAVIVPLSMVQLELQRRIIDDAIGTSDRQLLVLLCSIYLGVVVGHGALKYVMQVFRGRISELVTANLRKATYYCIYTVVKPQGWRGDGKSAVDEGTVVSMLSGEVEKLGGFAGESLSTPLLQAGTMVAVLGYMIWVEPYVAFLALGVYSPQLVIVPWLQGRINAHAKERAERVRELGSFVVDNAREAAESDEVPPRFLDMADGIVTIRMRIYRLKFGMKSFNNLLSNLGTFGVLFLGGWLVIDGRTEVGTIVAFISGFSRLGEPWRELISFYRQVADAHMKYALLVDSLPARSQGDLPPTGDADFAARFPET